MSILLKPIKKDFKKNNLCRERIIKIENNLVISFYGCEVRTHVKENQKGRKNKFQFLFNRAFLGGRINSTA